MAQRDQLKLALEEEQELRTQCRKYEQRLQQAESNDFITPHETPFKDPTPIEFLKVLPNVEFTFFFKVVPISFKGKIITTSEILNLYKQILLDTGIGAKTNVGYGQLQHDEPDEDKASSPTMT